MIQLARKVRCGFLAISPAKSPQAQNVWVKRLIFYCVFLCGVFCDIIRKTRKLTKRNILYNTSVEIACVFWKILLSVE
jgi:hypothetical protein